MSQTVTIYALAEPDSPSRIRYIGKTRKPLHRRLCEHIAERNRKSSNHRRNWIKKLFSAWQTAVIWPLEICSPENWIEREQFWIKFFKPLGLVNGTDGGEGGIGNSGWKWSKEALEKISAIRKGKPLSEQNAAMRRVQLREKAIPLAHTPEATKKRIETFRRNHPKTPIQINLFRPYVGKKQSVESRVKRGIAMKGKIRPHVIMPGGKWVQCIETSEVFVSIWRASQATGIPCCKIRRSFQRGVATKGLHWRLM